MSDPISGSGLAGGVLTGASIYGLLTGTDYGVVFGAFAGAVFYIATAADLSASRRLAYFIVSYIAGILCSGLVGSKLANLTGYSDKPLDAIGAVIVSALAVNILTFLNNQDIGSLVALITRRGGSGGATRGNPQTGTPATDLDDDYFDMLQEELCSVVEASGASLEKARHDQLLTALRALLLSRKNPFGDIKSDGTVKTALENLGLGEAAKRNVGNGQNQIPDMAAFASSLSSTGFQKLPSGLIIQWGIVSGASNYTVTYPVTFPNRSLALLAVPHTTSLAGISAMGIANCSDITKSQFYIIVGGISQGEIVKYERSCFWVAIGV